MGTPTFINENENEAMGVIGGISQNPWCQTLHYLCVYTQFDAGIILLRLQMICKSENSTVYPPI